MSSPVSPPDYDLIEPYAPAMIESLRSVGYDLPMAVADLADNSISAGATTIDISFIWDGENSVIAIEDNGSGMTEAKLKDAMRIGSSDPTEIRARSDLGRFGLGLKTASFSQCREFTVHTKTATGILSTRRWDLEYIRSSTGWRVLKTGTPAAEPFAGGLEQSGTAVVWEKLDRLVAGTSATNAQHRDAFNAYAQVVERHISMVFHRFMTGTTAVRFRINGRQIKPWDPFLEYHEATQHPDPHVFNLRGARIQVDSFVLPHHSKLTTEEHSLAAGSRGWLAHQGFYIYRNKRLLVAGDWLNLGVRKEEHCKLARIRVDIPNTIDDLWHIDVKKSTAKVPRSLIEDLANIGRVTREKAVAVYRHRGKVIHRTHGDKDTFMWEQKIKHGKVSYHLNRDHPLLKRVVKEGSSSSSAMLALLRLIEESVPIPLIALTSTEKSDSAAQPFEAAPSDEIYNVMVELFLALQKSGLTERQAIEKIRNIEPFERFPEYVENLSEVLKARGLK